MQIMVTPRILLLFFSQQWWIQVNSGKFRHALAHKACICSLRSSHIRAHTDTLPRCVFIKPTHVRVRSESQPLHCMSLYNKSMNISFFIRYGEIIQWRPWERQSVSEVFKSLSSLISFTWPICSQGNKCNSVKLRYCLSYHFSLSFFI